MLVLGGSAALLKRRVGFVCRLEEAISGCARVANMWILARNWCF